MEKLCLPVIKAKRPVWDTFPGAWYTIAIDAIMPKEGVAGCILSSLQDQWAKAFVTYKT